MPTFDTIIKGGTIVDGTRTPRYLGDVGIKDGKIAELGKLRSDKTVARELQAKGMFDKCIEWSNSPKNKRKPMR